MQSRVTQTSSVSFFPDCPAFTAFTAFPAFSGDSRGKDITKCPATNKISAVFMLLLQIVPWIYVYFRLLLIYYLTNYEKLFLFNIKAINFFLLISKWITSLQIRCFKKENPLRTVLYKSDYENLVKIPLKSIKFYVLDFWMYIFDIRMLLFRFEINKKKYFSTKLKSMTA